MRKIYFMRTVFISLFSILLFSCNNSTNKEQASSEKIVSKHTDAFNNSVQSALNDYHSLTEAFVNWDSVAVISRSKQLDKSLDSIKLDELNAATKQTALTFLKFAKKNLQAINSQKGIVQQRHGLDSLTQNLYQFLDVVKYDEKKIYLQKCPMAFNDSIPGEWLSEADSIRNPYMGLHHPHYGRAMIVCGETKATIDYVNKK